MKKIGRLAVKVQHEVVLVGGAVITIGEILASSLPKGAVQTGLRVALPVIVTVVQRTRSVPLPAVEQLLSKLQAK